MRESFSMFIRRRIGLVVVITFTANVIMFSAILSFTGSIPSEQVNVVHTMKNNSQDYNEKGAVPLKNRKQNENLALTSRKKEDNLAINSRKQAKIPTEQVNVIQTMKNNSQDYNEKAVPLKSKTQKENLAVNSRKKEENLAINSGKQAKTVKNSKQNNRKIYSNDKGQMDFEPSERVINPGNNILIAKSREDHEDLKVPNTFNEEYIKYFWKHPEFQIGKNVRMIQGVSGEITNFHNKTDKIKSRKSDNDRKFQGKSVTKKLADDKPKQDKPDSLKESTKYANRIKESENPRKERNAVDQHKNLQKHNKPPDVKDAPEMIKTMKNVSYMTMFPAKGQLGNQMFQLASLLGIADRGNFTPFLLMSAFDLGRIFRLPKEFTTDIDMSAITTFQTFSDYNYTQDTSIKLSQNLDVHRNWILDGYFQSFKYFSHVSDKVRKYLRFNKHLLQSAVKFIQTNVPAGHTKIAIHIRRGDFIHSYQMWLGRVAAIPEYFHRAMQYFQSRYDNITFIIVSDDMKWCKQYIKGDNIVYSTSHYTEKGVDLAIISECDHVIISVGTFGWWGGWLSGGTVVYYNKFPRPGSKLDETFVPENYYPSNWIALE